MYSVLGQTSYKKTKQNKTHTLLHSTLKDQSRPSPHIQDHTVAAMGGRLDWGGGGEDGGRGRRMICKEREGADAENRQERGRVTEQGKGRRRRRKCHCQITLCCDLRTEQVFNYWLSKERRRNEQSEKKEAVKLRMNKKNGEFIDREEGRKWEGTGGGVSLVSMSACRHWSS